MRELTADQKTGIYVIASSLERWEATKSLEEGQGFLFMSLMFLILIEDIVNGK
jgi:hypothetical protein